MPTKTTITITNTTARASDTAWQGLADDVVARLKREGNLSAKNLRYVFDLQGFAVEEAAALTVTENRTTSKTIAVN